MSSDLVGTTIFLMANDQSKFLNRVCCCLANNDPNTVPEQKMFQIENKDTSKLNKNIHPYQKNVK